MQINPFAPLAPLSLAVIVLNLPLCKMLKR